MLRVISIIILFFTLFACVNKKAELANPQGWLYYIDSSDTVKAISIDNQKIISVKYLPSSHGQHHISPDGKKLLYGLKEKVNDTTDYYNMYILDIASGNNQLLCNGYGGAWSHDGNHFIVFIDDTLWLYENSSLKRIKTFRYKNDWRLCSVDWAPSNKRITVFAYDRSNRDNTKLLLLSADSLNIVREENMDGMFTKRFAAVNDNVFLCCVQCVKCNPQQSDWNHILKVDLSKTNIFTHIQTKVYSVEDIAFIEHSQCVIYPDYNKKGRVIAKLENLDSSTIIIPSLYGTLVGWSENCVIKK